MTLSAQVGTTTHAQQTACMPAAAIVIALTDTREERTPDRRPERHFFRSACKDFLRTLKIPATQLQKTAKRLLSAGICSSRIDKVNPTAHVSAHLLPQFALAAHARHAFSCTDFDKRVNSLFHGGRVHGRLICGATSVMKDEGAK